jgi:hypothetical protein
MSATLHLQAGQCHCRCCGRTFRNLGGFDAHRPDRDGCGDPVAAGLVELDGLWATPEGHAQRTELAARLAAARSVTTGEDTP